MKNYAAPHMPQQIDVLIQAVQEASRKRGDRMTDTRRDVILALSKLKKPQGAYRILELVNKKRIKKLSAMSLYRNLDYLTDLGFVIKIDSTNSYALCTSAGDCHDHVMIVCDKCGSLDEIHDNKAFAVFKKLAKARGHELRNHAVEIHGVCEKCH